MAKAKLAQGVNSHWGKLSSEDKANLMKEMPSLAGSMVATSLPDEAIPVDDKTSSGSQGKDTYQKSKGLLAEGEGTRKSSLGFNFLPSKEKASDSSTKEEGKNLEGEKIPGDATLHEGSSYFSLGFAQC